MSLLPNQNSLGSCFELVDATARIFAAGNKRRVSACTFNSANEFSPRGEGTLFGNSQIAIIIASS